MSEYRNLYVADFYNLKFYQELIKMICMLN